MFSETNKTVSCRFSTDIFSQSNGNRLLTGPLVDQVAWLLRS